MILSPEAKLLALQQHFSEWPGSHASFPNEPHTEQQQLAHVEAAWQQLMEGEGAPPDSFLIWTPFESLEPDALIDDIENLAVSVQATLSKARTKPLVFAALAAGTTLKDLRTGEWWEKTGADTAVCLTGPFAGDVDTFLADELVHHLPEMSAAALLEAEFSPDGDGQWPGLPTEAWQRMVAFAETRLGYWEKAASVQRQMLDPEFQSWAAQVSAALAERQCLDETPDYLWLDAYQRGQPPAHFAKVMDKLQRS